jgi:hypothetical protein
LESVTTNVQNKPKFFPGTSLALHAFLPSGKRHKCEDIVNKTNRSQTGSFSLLGNISGDGANVIAN